MNNSDFRIFSSVYSTIKSALQRPETGGILGADSTGNIVAFHHDISGATETNKYTPDVKALNRVIQEWFQQGITFAGFVHTHAGGVNTLSTADAEYAQTVKKTCHMDSVLMLLYLPEKYAFYEYMV